MQLYKRVVDWNKVIAIAVTVVIVAAAILISRVEVIVVAGFLDIQDSDHLFHVRRRRPLTSALL